jgi:hypothetical protein
MASPVVETTNTTVVSSNTTNHPINMPSGIAVGDLLIVAYAQDGAQTISWPADWSDYGSGSQGTGVGFKVLYKIAEGSDTLTITAGGNEQSAAVAYRISGAEDPQPEAFQATTGTSSTPDCPNISAPAASEDWLYLALAGCDRRTFNNSTPANYSNLQRAQSAGTNGASVAGSERQLTSGAAENPAAYAIASSDGWVAYTVRVHPPGAVDVPRAPGVGTLVLAGQAPLRISNVFRRPGAGALTFAGLAPLSVQTLNKEMPAGALTLTGQLPTCFQAFNLQPPAGTLTLAGLAPALLVSVTLDVPVGTLTLAGLAPTASVGFSIEVPTGALNLFGCDPPGSQTAVLDDFNRTDEDPALGWSWTVGDEGQVLSNEVGASNADGVVSGVHTATGSIADCEAYYTIRAGGGELAIVHARNQSSTGGFTNTYEVLYNTIGNVQLIRRQSGFNNLGTVVTGRTPQAGDVVGIRVISTRLEAWLKRVGESWELILTATDTAFSSGYIGFGSGSDNARRWDDFGGGVVTCLSLGFEVHPPAGTLTLAGLAPALQFDIKAQPPVGTLTFAGLAPSLLVSVTLDVPVGTLTLAGLAPQAQVTLLREPGVGTLTLAGQQATCFQATFYAPPAGTLTLAGLAPTLVTGISLEPGVGTLVLAGLAPALQFDFVIDVPVGTLVLQGHVPGIGLNTLIDVPVGTLVLAGLAPTAAVPVIMQPDAGILTLHLEPPRMGFGIDMPFDPNPC